LNKLFSFLVSTKPITRTSPQLTAKDFADLNNKVFSIDHIYSFEDEETVKVMNKVLCIEMMMMKMRRRERELHVIHEFGSYHDTCDQQSMNIEGVDGERGLSLSETVEVDIGNDEA